MVNPNLPDVPAPLKSIEQYLKIAASHHERDPVVSYWCRLYALQTGLKLSTKTPEERAFLMKLMDLLETTKKELRENEAITNEIVAQAHLENWALKLFLYADKRDRAGDFSKATVKSFFSAGLLYDVLTVFGELTEETTQKGKYAKWKATYIHNCLKNGETPVPGPLDDNMEGFDSAGADNSAGSQEKSEEGEASLGSNGRSNTGDVNSFDAPYNVPKKGSIDEGSSEIADDYRPNTEAETEGGIKLSLDQMNKAQKLIKWAGSALNYDDVPTAVLNLRKAINLLTTGQDAD